MDQIQLSIDRHDVVLDSGERAHGHTVESEQMNDVQVGPQKFDAVAGRGTWPADRHLSPLDGNDGSSQQRVPAQIVEAFMDIGRHEQSVANSYQLPFADGSRKIPIRHSTVKCLASSDESTIRVDRAFHARHGPDRGTTIDPEPRVQKFCG
ncbi:hypothetical protein GCM10028864_53510 [Microlunatus parietis]